jgi:hypothetical protein
MANEEHLALLKQGVEVKPNSVKPNSVDLSSVELSSVK